MAKYIGTRTNVLDYGHVTLVDYMGDDSAIVQAARVSYGEGTKTVSDDRTLLRYLMRHRHTSPFEHVEFKFHCKMPIFVARQWIRHRTANVNEVSGRYSELPAEFYIPEIKDIRAQSKSNRQGREEELQEDVAGGFSLVTRGTGLESFKTYKDYLEIGLARELARINLPLSTYTEWYWKIDLHNLFHFLKLRMDKHAQWEIQQYANALYGLIKPIVPSACEAFEDYVLNAVTLSAQEWDLVRHYFFKEEDFLEAIEMPNDEFDFKLSKLELKEFIKKIGIE